MGPLLTGRHRQILAPSSGSTSIQKEMISSCHAHREKARLSAVNIYRHRKIELGMLWCYFDLRQYMHLDTSSISSQSSFHKKRDVDDGLREKEAYDTRTRSLPAP